MQSFYMGIDVSKGYADFMIINAKKSPVIQGFQLDDTFQGHQALYNNLTRFLATNADSTLFVGLESTGGYENNWYNSLIAFQGSLNIQTARLNPLGVNYNSKAKLKKNTTDTISAQNIAEYMVAHPEKISYQKQDRLASLRKQWGFIQMLTKQRTQLQNQLESLLYTAQPQLLSYCQDGTPAWMLQLLTKYPTAGRLKKARVKTLSAIPYISKKRAQQLLTEAKCSVASASDPATEQIIVATVGHILQLNQTIANQTNQLKDHCDIAEVDLLKTFAGIGDKSAIGLILEIQTVERFAAAKHLVSFFGLHPVYKISGDGIGGIKVSKQGRKEPRRILYMVALSAIKHNPLIKQLYEKQINSGKHHMAAMVICMHKILRIIYGMLKNNTAFDPQTDIANRQKSSPAKTKPAHNNKARRFQSYDKKAPVSRRQRNKRLERDRSHSVNDTKSGITEPVPVGNIIANMLSDL